MASQLEFITRLTPQSDIPEDLTTDESYDIELPLDTPLPLLSPIVPSADSSGARPRLEPILSLKRERSEGTNKKRKKRRVLKQSASIQLETLTSSAINRALPPLDNSSVSNEPIPSKDLSPPLEVIYEPIRLLSDDDISQIEPNIVGNPISTYDTKPQFLLKSEKAFFEKKDGRFAPVSKQETSLATPPAPSYPVISTVSRRTLSRMCNYVFNTSGLAAYSMLTGFTICHTVFVFTLATLGTQDLNLVINISKLSLPFNGLFYFLTTVSIVYLADRVDIARLNRKYIREAIQYRKLSLLVNIIALFLTSISLLLTLSLVHIDLQIHYLSIPTSQGWDTLWPDLLTNTTTTTTTTTTCPTILFSVNSQDYSAVSEPVSGRVTALKMCLLIRAVLCLCGWLFVISSPTQNRWFSFVNRAMLEEI